MSPGPGPGTDPEPALITCRCGRRLRLAGAVPGRVGRCPSCGATFRVPEAGLPPPASAPAFPLDPLPLDSPGTPEPEPDGYDLIAPDSPALAPSARPRVATPAGSTYSPPKEPERRGKTGKRRRVTVEPVGRGGILPLPRSPESGALGALLYPIWDGLGLMALILLPPILTVTSLIVFALIPMVLGGGVLALFGPIAFAFIAVFVIALGFALSWLSEVLIASAQGDVHHPGWPEFDLGAIFLSLLRWGLALGIGFALAWWPASAVLAAADEPGLIHRLGFMLILSLGGLYGLMALLSVSLHEDALAVTPGMVIAGASKVGAGYLAAWLLFAASLELGTLIVSGIYRLDGFGLILVATWAAWVFAVYAGMVVARALGRAYHRRAKRVGWFPSSRPRRDDAPAAAPTPAAPPGAEI